MLSKLHTAKGVRYNSADEAANPTCYPGTRVEILQQIYDWGKSPSGEHIFWLNGMAGTGKSTISRTVAQWFSDNSISGASFFFKRGEGDRSRLTLLFTTIAAQLVHQLPSLAPHVRDVIEAYPDINEKPPEEPFTQLIAEPLKKLTRPSQPSQPSQRQMIVIIVDALDECDSPQQLGSIIRLLSQARDITSVCLKFFLTSRPELPIRLGFEDINGKYENLVLQKIPKSVIQRDITAFMKHELLQVHKDYNKSVPSSRHLPQDWPDEMYIQQLVEMAIPLFIFAATICRFIQDRRLGSPRDQLARILEHRDSQQSNLDATYLPVLHQLHSGLSKSEKHEVTEKFKKVVGSIVVLASPLSTSSLSRLLDVSEDTIGAQLDVLHSVLSIPTDPHESVRLLHLSFRDFLVDRDKASETDKYPFWIDERETHEQLAIHCLRLLSTDNNLRRDICGLRRPGAQRSDIDPETIKASLPLEVQYACLYWVYHWKKSESSVTDDGLVDRFLNQHLLHWLEALALVGRVRECITMVAELIGLLDVGESEFPQPFYDHALIYYTL